MDTELRLRIESSLIEDLKKEAKKLGLSLSAYVRLILNKRGNEIK